MYNICWFKVTRDTIVSGWQWNERGLVLDKKFGSGYPGDEICVDWLARASDKVFGYPDIVRFSWSTTRDSLEKLQAVKVHW